MCYLILFGGNHNAFFFQNTEMNINISNYFKYKSFVTFLQNSCYVPQKKESNAGLEQHEFEKMNTIM